ncbi:MAG: tRNA pseudouridine(38-40) synthase TruA [Candidatus Omnitrophota bacterium]|jgi:tRNA pseudouridine38-40 synthase
MRNIKLTLEYDGTRFAGWQSQRTKKVPTIQATIEGALHQILQEQVKLVASGRTDAGVHAQEQVANFKTGSLLPLARMHEGMNALLPADISVVNIEEAAVDFHSRFHAKSKVYCYTILNRVHRSALLKDRAYFCRFPLKVSLMRQEAACLLGKHNFKAFQATAKKEKNPVKNITQVKIEKKGDCIRIYIQADGFLYNMVRNISGTLIDIGRGKFPQGSMKKILLSKDRKQAGVTAPACGLCLMKVKY